MIIKQGSDKTYIFYIYDAGGNLIKTAPADIQFTAACPNNPNQSVLVKKWQKGITLDTETGKYTMTVDSQDTINLPPAKYPFDIKIKRANRQFFVVLSGVMDIRQSYTGEI